MRKVSPLGSDQELDVDVRLIAATNVDLKGLIEKGLFREDLYYRLEVLTIRTPALRDHRESIPILVDYFLKQACRLVNKEGIGLSRGALEKLKSHPWPGNVRELMNCVTRAVVMAGGNLIQAGDLKLGGEEPRPGGKGPEPAPEAQAPLPLFAPGGERSTLPEGLSARQRKAYPHLLQNGWVSRSEYQRIVGNDLPSRTAIYDLQDLVKKGIVRKEGKGPATQYYLVGWRESAT
jgi:DNA-binding NtrC family response regulator